MCLNKGGQTVLMKVGTDTELTHDNGFVIDQQWSRVTDSCLLCPLSEKEFALLSWVLRARKDFWHNLVNHQWEQGKALWNPKEQWWSSNAIGCRRWRESRSERWAGPKSPRDWCAHLRSFNSLLKAGEWRSQICVLKVTMADLNKMQPVKRQGDPKTPKSGLMSQR